MDNPLGTKQYSDLNKAAAKLNELRLHIENAKRAGTDVGERCLICDYLEKRIDQLKQVYFPGKR